MFNDKRSVNRKLRQDRVRKRVRGTDQRPRLCIFRSASHIYAQVISDETGRTLASVSTLSPDLGEGEKTKGKIAAAKRIGSLIARKCLDRSISKVVFDRNGFLYHGRVKALADAAREAGLTL